MERERTSERARERESPATRDTVDAAAGKDAAGQVPTRWVREESGRRNRAGWLRALGGVLSGGKNIAPVECSLNQRLRSHIREDSERDGAEGEGGIQPARSHKQRLRSHERD